MTYLSHIASLVWQVLVFGILVGAGLPALFALGLRALGTAPVTASASGSVRNGGAAAGHGHADPLRVVLAVACFAVGVAAAVAGIAFLVATGHR